MSTILIALVFLGILIFVHELGHFLVAKWAGVGVKVFSLGFGARLGGFKRGRTDYRVSLVPLGGYVRMVGESPNEEVEPEDVAYSFRHKPVKWRAAIVAAGPLANLIFAILVFYLLLTGWGLTDLSTRVGQVQAGWPAAEAGLQKDDVIKAINGQPTRSWAEMVGIIKGGNGQEMKLTVLRDGKLLQLRLRPRPAQASNLFGEPYQTHRIGIVASQEVVVEEVGLLPAIGLALEKTYQAGELVVLSVIKVIQRKVSMDNIGGPILIAQAAGEAARHGLAPLLSLAALISVNLAILNLLPIPILDGGHLFFFLIEALTRRPVSTVVREKAQQVGMAVIIMLMAVLFYNDIARLITSTTQ